MLRNTNHCSKFSVRAHASQGNKRGKHPNHHIHTAGSDKCKSQSWTGKNASSYHIADIDERCCLPFYLPLQALIFIVQVMRKWTWRLISIWNNLLPTARGDMFINCSGFFVAVPSLSCSKGVLSPLLVLIAGNATCQTLWEWLLDFQIPRHFQSNCNIQVS